MASAFQRTRLLIRRSISWLPGKGDGAPDQEPGALERSEEHTSELQSRPHLVCRLLLEKKKNDKVLTLFFYTQTQYHYLLFIMPHVYWTSLSLQQSRVFLKKCKIVLLLCSISFTLSAH